MEKSRQWDHRFGIANHMGAPWTVRTFDTENEAQDYLDKQRVSAIFKGALEDHRVVPVTITVTLKE